GASSHIDGLGGANHSSRKFVTRKLSQHDIGSSLAGLYAARIFLGNVHVYAQHASLSDMEKIGPRGCIAAGIDEITNIGVARGDHTVERSVYLFKRNQCFVVAHVSGVCVYNCLIGAVRTNSVVHVLLRDSMFCQQSLVTVSRDSSQLQIRLRRNQITASLL